MNSAKIFASIVTLVALFPAASWANNVSGNNQEVNLNSTVVGNGNVLVTETNQKIVGFQKSRFSGTNVGGTSQRINANTTVIGDGNIDIKKAFQSAINGQKTK
jgi:hypothetical protein